MFENEKRSISAKLQQIAVDVGDIVSASANEINHLNAKLANAVDQYNKDIVPAQALKKQNLQYQSDLNTMKGERDHWYGIALTMKQEKDDQAALIAKLQKDNKKLNDDLAAVKKSITVDRQMAAPRRDAPASPKELDIMPKPPADQQKQIFNSNLVNAFNKWAMNSPAATSLPGEFCFLEGEIKKRVAQTIIETGEKTKWISNRVGSQKYIFPNPNFLEKMCDLNDLYDLDYDKVKDKGKNRVRIISPCEMMDSGVINSPGKLELL